MVGEVEVVERENENGEAFKVVNFSVVSKDEASAEVKEKYNPPTLMLE